MKTSEIIYNIQNIRQKGIQSDTNDLSDSQIMFMVDYYRAKILKQQLDSGQQIGSTYHQDMGLIELVKSNEIETNIACGFPIEILKCLVRTKIKIPQIIEHNGEFLINYLGTHNFLNAYTNTTYIKLVWDLRSRYTKNTPKYFYLDGYIYIYNTDLNLKYVRLIALFAEPSAVELIKKENNSSDTLVYDNYDFEYPVSSSMIDTINKLIIESEYRLLLAMQKDNTNNQSNES